MAELIATEDAPAPGGAPSQAFRSGCTLRLAGRVGIDPSTGEVAEGGAGQTRQALRNLKAVLRAAGGSLQTLLKTTYFLTRVYAFAEFNAAYEEVMGDDHPPRSTVGVELAGGYLSEIEGLAVIE
jgi:2-iminobutanoate/2-iminopropanoate deaminase